MAYGIFVLLGCGVRLPWNVYITESEYWTVRFQEEPRIDRIAKNFMSLFGMAYTGT